MYTCKGLFNQSVGDVSDKYQVYITPAGWTFSIWSFIYIFLGAGAIYCNHINFCNLLGFRRRNLTYLFERRYNNLSQIGNSLQQSRISYSCYSQLGVLFYFAV